MQNRLPLFGRAVYDIQWHNVQQSAFLTPLALPGAINVGEAYSRGFETELYGVFTTHLSAQFNYTYDETKMTSLNPLALTGLSVPPPAAGSPLPGTPKSTAAVALEYGPHRRRWAMAESCASPSTAHYQELAHTGTVGNDTDSRRLYDAGRARKLCANALDIDALYRQSDQLWRSESIPIPIRCRSGVSNYQALVSRPRTIGLTVAYSVK